MYFSHINLLRGFAALSVLVYHVIELLPWEDFPTVPAALLWFRVGWMGVDLFFVISGFVIMLSALHLYDKHSLPNARKQFLVRRVARIVPLYLLTAVMYLIFVSPEMIEHPQFWLHALTHLTFTHNLHPSTHGAINGPNWSVAAEFQFYMLVLILLPWLARLKPLTLLVLGVGCAWACRAMVFGISEYFDFPVTVRFAYATQMLSMMDLFVYGMVLAKLFFDPVARKWLERLPAFIRHYPLTVIALFTLAVGWAAFAVYWTNPTYWGNGHMVIFWRTLFGLTLIGLIAFFALLPPLQPSVIPAQAGIVGRKIPAFAGMTRKALKPVHVAGYYLGDISYGIYLWHQPTIMVLKDTSLAADPIQFLGVTLFVVLTLSMLSWHLMEKPFIRMGKRVRVADVQPA